MESNTVGGYSYTVQHEEHCTEDMLGCSPLLFIAHLDHFSCMKCVCTSTAHSYNVHHSWNLYITVDPKLGCSSYMVVDYVRSFTVVLRYLHNNDCDFREFVGIVQCVLCRSVYIL